MNLLPAELAEDPAGSLRDSVPMPANPALGQGRGALRRGPAGSRGSAQTGGATTSAPRQRSGALLPVPRSHIAVEPDV